MTTMFSPSARITVPSDVLIQDLEGEAVLLNIASGCYFGLDAMGHSMWLALVETKSVEEAVQRLLNEFEVHKDQLEQDLQDLLSKLVDHGLLEVHP